MDGFPVSYDKKLFVAFVKEQIFPRIDFEIEKTPDKYTFNIHAICNLRRRLEATIDSVLRLGGSTLGERVHLSGEEAALIADLFHRVDYMEASRALWARLEKQQATT